MLELFEEIYPLYRRLIRRTLQRSGLPTVEWDDFESTALFHLIKDNYRVLRQCRSREQLPGFLQRVLGRLLLDHRVRSMGKWRPSAHAARVGAVAVALERLLYRERLSHDEALARLQALHGRALADRAATIIATPPTPRRRMVPLEDAIDLAAPEPTPEDRQIAQQTRRHAASTMQLVHRELERLSLEDRTLLRMRYRDGMAIIDIARALKIDARPIYRRFEAVQKQLWAALNALGIDREDLPQP